MNIRGTDSTALAAVTDLFVVPAPSRDGRAGGFQQALQPPRPYEPSPTPAPRQDTKTLERKAPEASHEDDSSCRSEVGKASEATSATAETASSAEHEEAASEDAVVSESEETPASEEGADAQDVAAESIAVAAVAVAEQPVPQQPPVAGTPAVEATGASGAEDAGEAESASLVANEQLVADKPRTTIVASQQVDEALVAETAADEAIPEFPTDAATAESSQPGGGIGVLPSAVAPPATNGAVRNTPSRTTKAATSTNDKTQLVKSSTQDESAQETTADVSTDGIGAGQMRNPDNDSDATAKKSDQPLFAVDKSPVQQPAEALAQAETKLEPPAAAAETPVASELNSTHHPAHDPTKLTTTQPLANAAINRLPAQALVRGTPQQPVPAPLHVDAARFLQRVTKAFESARERGGEIRLRLSPPELGALRVEVNMSEHGLAARVEVETNEARAVLLENLPALRERLAEQGLRLERFDVELSHREPDQQGGNLPDQPRDRQSQSEARSVRNAVPRPSALPTTQPEITPSTGWQDRQLNVIV